MANWRTALGRAGLPPQTPCAASDSYHTSRNACHRASDHSTTSSYPHQDQGAAPLLRYRLCSYIERSEEHTSELQSLMRISYAVFCLKKKKKVKPNNKRYIASLIHNIEDMERQLECSQIQ